VQGGQGGQGGQESSPATQQVTRTNHNASHEKVNKQQQKISSKRKAERIKYPSS
jgi:hypothetical protein